MSAREEMRLKCRALDDATRHSEEAAASASKQEMRVADLRRQLERRRAALLAERVAATGNVDFAPGSAAELQDLDLDIEAATLLAAQLEQRRLDANSALEKAKSVWAKSVCKFAQEIEAGAIAEIELALAALAKSCARGVAAAKVSRDFGEIRGSYNMPVAHWFGSAGQLVAQLRQIAWPQFPTSIDPSGFGRPQTAGEVPTTLAGVDEAEISIRKLIDEVCT